MRVSEAEFVADGDVTWVHVGEHAQSAVSLSDPSYLAFEYVKHLALAVEQVAEEQGLTLDGDLDCTATIDSGGALEAACTGTATSGEAITGAYTGTADIDAERCTADVVVAVDGATVADESAVDCFSAG